MWEITVRGIDQVLRVVSWNLTGEETRFIDVMVWVSGG